MFSKLKHFVRGTEEIADVSTTLKCGSKDRTVQSGNRGSDNKQRKSVWTRAHSTLQPALEVHSQSSLHGFKGYFVTMYLTFNPNYGKLLCLICLLCYLT